MRHCTATGRRSASAHALHAQDPAEEGVPKYSTVAPRAGGMAGPVIPRNGAPMSDTAGGASMPLQRRLSDIVYRTMLGDCTAGNKPTTTLPKASSTQKGAMSGTSRCLLYAA